MDIRDDLYKNVTVDNKFLFELWQPEKVAVVIGASQKPETEIHIARCTQHHVPMLKRRGGGGAVVLMPGILCFTLAFISDKSPSPYYFFQVINEFIIKVLTGRFSIQDLRLRGTSDIAMTEKKILGCSIYKSRNLIFYQGSLLVNPDLTLVPYYLKHPTKEPDYRKGRKHLDFITSLARQGHSIPVNQLKIIFTQEIAKNFPGLIF